MKKSLLTLVVITSLTISSVQAQNNTAPQQGHRIGLIDMAHVFQNYKKFEALREALTGEIEKSDAELKAKAERFQKLQAELKKYEVGAAGYEQAEKNILDQKGDIESFRAATTRRLARRESEMFKVIYTDVTKAVKLYAEYAKFDHVMRYNSKGVEETMSPQEAVQTMNKTFIYTKSQNDITKTVLQYLNDQYAKNPTTGPGGGQVRQTGGNGRTPIRK